MFCMFAVYDDRDSFIIIFEYNRFVVLKSEGKVLASIVKNTQEEIYLSFPDVKAEVLERVFEYCRYAL